MSDLRGDRYTYETLDDFVDHLQSTLDHIFYPGRGMASEVLARQAADPSAMEMAMSYCCLECYHWFAIVGLSDGMGYPRGPHAPYELIVEDALLGPCVPVASSTVRYTVRRLQIEPKPNDEKPAWPAWLRLGYASEAHMRAASEVHEVIVAFPSSPRPGRLMRRKRDDHE